MDSHALNLHQQAETAREKEDFLKALELTDQATVAYQKEGNTAGVAEIQSSRFLTLRHLFEQTGDQNFMILAKHAAQAAVEIARSTGQTETLVIPLFNLGKAQETLEQYQKAVENYKEAIAYFTQTPPPQHNRSAVMQEMIIHLSFAEYKTGDKTALERLEKALEDLVATNEVRYNKDVWMSGGYMDIAEMLKDDDPDKARLALDRAKEIIDANPDLTLRKKQWEKLAAQF